MRSLGMRAEEGKLQNVVSNLCCPQTIILTVVEGTCCLLKRDLIEAADHASHLPLLQFLRLVSISMKNCVHLLVGLSIGPFVHLSNRLPMKSGV